MTLLKTDQDIKEAHFLLKTITVQIRIFGVRKGKVNPNPVEHYIASCPPRVGEKICLEQEKATVFNVEWFVTESAAHADVFCDVSHLPERFDRKHQSPSSSSPSPA